jgi:hypothetical protein
VDLFCPASKADSWRDGGKRGKTGETGEEFDLFRCRKPAFKGTELKFSKNLRSNPVSSI